jgi:Zn-finger nucleic acid-binding protein
VALLIATFRDVEVDYCDRCRGVWLDAGEVEALLQATGATPSDPLVALHSQPVPANRQRHCPCPRCDGAMAEVVFANGPTLDRCPAGHGLWFDAEELQQLLALYPPASGAARTVDYLNDVFGTNPRRNTPCHT